MIVEPYYYSKMDKVQQTAYHAIRQGLLEISDSIQIPGMEAEELYNVFFHEKSLFMARSTILFQSRFLS